MNPVDQNVTMKDIDTGAFLETKKPNCEDEYEIKYEGKKYGMITCNERAYLIIGSHQILFDSAQNFSINPEIKPGASQPEDSFWYKIDFENQSYLCIAAPLSRSGVGAAHLQYYIVEQAFDDNSIPVLFYYFLKENIAPITSKTL